MDDIATLSNEVSLVCGHLAVEMDLMALAVELAGKVLAKSPGDRAGLLLLAKIHLVKREYGEVVELLGGEAGKDLKLWAMFSLACYRLGLYDRAVEAMEQCRGGEEEEDVELDLNLNVLECRMLLLADVQERPLQTTVPQFERTLELTQLFNVPTLHLEVLLTRAQLFEKSGDWEKCFYDLEDSLSILQSHEATTHFAIKDFLYKATFAYLYKIFLQEKTHRGSEATDQLFQQCFELPNTSETIHMLSVARHVYCAIRGQRPDIAQFTSTTSAVSPEFKPFVCYALARVLVELGGPDDLVRALQFYRLSLELDSSRAYVWISLASLHLKLGQFADALLVFSNTLEMLSSVDDGQYSTSRHSYLERRDNLSSLSWFGLAQVYLNTDDIAKSLDALQRAVSFLTNDELLEQRKLEEFAEILRSGNGAALRSLKEKIVLPEIPLHFFLNPIFYLNETQVFRVESRLERSSFTLPKLKLPNKHSGFNPSYRSNSNHDSNKKTKKKSVRKTSDGNKTTKLKNKKKNDIFRRANLSISKRDKNHLNQTKKKHSHTTDEPRKSSTHTTNPNHCEEHIYNQEISGNGIPLPVGHNNIITNSDDNNHINTAPVVPQTNQATNLAPDQHQHFGYLYQEEQNQPNQTNQLPQHHKSAPYNYPAFISSHNPGIYPASYTHPIQQIGFSASPSFYYPQQSVEEAFRNNSNGLGDQSLQPSFGPPVIMPQFPNPIFISDATRFAASSLQPTMLPLMASQQPLQPKSSPVEARHAGMIRYMER